MSPQTSVPRRVVTPVRTAAKRAKQMEKLLKVEQDARSERLALHKEWSDQVDAECERFGRDVPSDPVILDLLAQVEVHDDDVWEWIGSLNNKALPVMRRNPRNGDSSERSVIRMIAIAFGVIAPDWNGTLFPTKGKLNVNPWHRQLRASHEVKVGNMVRSTKKGRTMCKYCDHPAIVVSREMCSKHYERWRAANAKWRQANEEVIKS